MRKPHVDDYVRLTQDIPELALQRGEVGVVRSTWFAPSMAYEVEFHPVGLNGETRALLLAEQVQVEEGSLFRHDAPPLDSGEAASAAGLHYEHH